MSLAYIVVTIAVLVILGLAHTYDNPSSSRIVGFLWFLAVVVPLWWLWNVRVGRPYREWIKNHPANKRARLYYILPMIILIAGFIINDNYQYSMEPTSFTASDIHFVTT